ncbi:kinase-like protein [Lophium mytilinum]|uniref:Kinase-like protein n=1 Tax=Lophium mytilinum TaxID=390894 RepID=A0A6A6QSL0_9PEZI|nr:kinase-like protein [Lophium mytilinum]
MENNIELGGIQAKIQSQGSSFDSRRREVRRRRFQSSEYSTRKRSNNDHALEEESASQPLLLILRILSYHKIRLFSVNPNQRWNLRQALGDGSTFSVDGAELPIWDALAHLRYRNLDIKGPKEKFNFVDHTRISWQHTTLVAYKALVGRKSMDRGMIMQDLITELRVLCHRPLQKHPNFVRLLGVAWISEIDMGYTDDAEPREWPTVVVEKAPHGSLLDFLSSEEFKTTRSSLMAKLNLCIDVLIAIVALHACDILHGDIKCENALVFNTEKGTAENWRVKLSDFGHAILNMQGKGSSGFTRREVIGTDFYSPPELSSAEAVIDVANMKSVDVWCWGLLMWRVLIDGMEYSDAEGHQIDPGAMRALREQGNIAATAKDACKNYLNLHHSREGAALSSIVGILVDALSHNAADRPDALSLLSRLRRASSDR